MTSTRHCKRRHTRTFQLKLLKFHEDFLESTDNFERVEASSQQTYP